MYIISSPLCSFALRSFCFPLKTHETQFVFSTLAGLIVVQPKDVPSVSWVSCELIRSAAALQIHSYMPFNYPQSSWRGSCKLLFPKLENAAWESVQGLNACLWLGWIESPSFWVTITFFTGWKPLGQVSLCWMFPADDQRPFSRWAAASCGACSQRLWHQSVPSEMTFDLSWQ